MELAELAVEVGSVLGAWEPAEQDWLYELRAYAWAHLGNARRVAGNLPSAELAFACADSWWKQGERLTGDALGYEARLHALKASLRREQRRFDEALRLLDRALAADTDHSLAVTILINKANVLEQTGDLDQAITLLKETAPRAEALDDPRLLLCVRHNLVDALSKAGRYREAQVLLPQAERLAREVGSDLDRLRLSWTAGRIFGGLGERDRARIMLQTVRQEFIDRAIPYDTALVSLDLAKLLLAEQRLEEVKVLAAEMLVIFEAQQVHREALAAVAIFQQAAGAETLTLDFLERLTAYLRAAESDPALRFQPTHDTAVPGDPADEETAH